MRRSLITPAAILLIACTVVLPACKKNSPSTGEDNPNPGTAPSAGVNSDYLFFAHLNAKDIRESKLVTEIKDAFVKAGGMAEWDRAEGEVASVLGGVKPTEIDSATVCVTEFSSRGEPGFVMIVKANKPLVKASVFGLGPQAKADNRGFYSVRGIGALIHFPDDKTLAILHPDVADKYLDGYAKDRAGWPMTAELTKAAAGHTLFAVAQLGKLPSKVADNLDGPLGDVAGPFLSARTVTVIGDLKGKEISVAARVAFADAATADKAKERATGLIATGVKFIEEAMNGKKAAENAWGRPVLKEALRSLTEAKVEVTGSELTVSGNYKADFDIGPIVQEAVKQMRAAALRMTAANNLKQIGLAMHNYASANNSQIPVHGIGPKAAPLKNATEKPLLSWRVAILPYVEQNALYKEFKLDEPWDSDHNKKLMAKMPKIYAPVAKPGKEGYTHLQMVIGPNAMQPAEFNIGNIPDGTSNTIAVVEASEPVIWTKPDDVMLPGKELPKDLRKKFGGQFPKGFNVLLWDGSVRFVSDSISDQTLARAIDPKDGSPLGDDW
jgi:hypothetical protein